MIRRLDRLAVTQVILCQAMRTTNREMLELGSRWEAMQLELQALTRSAAGASRQGTLPSPSTSPANPEGDSAVKFDSSLH